MPNSTRISLCMIVKDEGMFIEDCLRSVSGLVDEIILVDTGSRDQTPEIAESLGALVYNFNWDNDFSSARNESLKHACGDWIIVLDADEVIDKNDHARIIGLVRDDDADAYRLVQRNYQKESTHAEWVKLDSATTLAHGCNGYLPSPLVRLFRNTNDVRFKGKVHELVEHDLLALNRKIIDTDIPIHHYGKISGQQRILRKQELYAKIGKEKTLSQPSNPLAFRDLGIQYIELNMFEKAESALEKAWSLNNEDAQTGFNLAISKAGTGKYPEAIEMYRKTIEIDPAHIGAINNMALLLQKIGGENSVIEGIYRKAIELNPEHHILRFNYAFFLEKTGSIDAAILEYQNALKINPDFSMAKQRLEKALKSHSKHSKMDESKFLIASGEACLIQQKWIEALDKFVSALEKDYTNPNLRFKCGYCLEMLGKIDEALEQYQEIMAKDPKHPETLFRLALAAHRQGFSDDSITLYKELLSADPDHIEGLFNMACLMEQDGKMEEALLNFNSLLEKIPDHVEAISRIKSIKNVLDQEITSNPGKGIGNII